MQRTKDYITTALVGALVIVIGLMLIPLMQFAPFPIFMVIWIGPLYSLSLYLLLEKTKRQGVLLLFSVLLGLILTMFMPFMLFISVFGGLVAFVTGHIVRLLSANLVGLHGIQAVAFPVAQVPAAYVLVMPLDSPSAYRLLLGLMLAVLVTSFLGFLLARLVARRLRVGT